MKLHLGCGKVHIEGFTNVDNRDLITVDVVDDVKYLKKFPKSSVEEIYACHILEHFKRNEVNEVLKNWYNVLRPSGVLIISVPDFSSIVKYYIKTKNVCDLIGLLYGGQEHEGNYHYYCWDFESIKFDLEAVGFCNVSQYDWKKSEFSNFDDFSKAYLPHANQSGLLMSLNVRATKL